MTLITLNTNITPNPHKTQSHSLRDNSEAYKDSLLRRATLDFESRKRPLVKHTNISSMPINTTLQHRKNVSAYKLLGHAQKLLSWNDIKAPHNPENLHRTRKCHRHGTDIGGQINVALSPNGSNSQASLRNIFRCNSIWACPVCYEVEAMKKGLAIKDAIRWAQTNGYKIIMITLTASHSRWMTLADMEVPFKRAWQSFASGRPYRRLLKKLQVMGYISNVDTTYTDNGWHYHKHILMFIDKQNMTQKIMNEVYIELNARWRNFLAKKGLKASKEHGFHVSDDDHAPNAYLAKVGITSDDKGNLSFEMSSSSTKDSKNVWQLLLWSAIGDQKCTRLYLEYVEHMSGKNWINWTHDLRSEVNEWIEYNPETTSENEPSEMVNWITVSRYWWAIVQGTGDYGNFLDVCAKTRDIDAVRDYLHNLRIQASDDNLLPMYQREFVPKAGSFGDIYIHHDWVAHVQ